MNAAANTSTGFKMSGGNWKMTSIIVLCGLLTISLYLASLIQTSKFLGSKDDWNIIQPQITNILILTIVGTVALTIAVILYFIQDPNKVMYFIIIASMLSLGMSYAAIAISAITKSSL